ncbi:MAG: PEP-CTERM system histidine kinase PrsK [Sphingomonadaceae bacterium]|nr:PEP-CTERM system histidine kinase PrsK [Sphingomonadaceae bacterium]
MVAGFAIQLVAALACAALALWLLKDRGHARPDRKATLVALAMVATWSLVAAAFGIDSTPALLAETLRDLAWLNLLYRLFEVDGRDRSVRNVRPVIGALAFVEALQPAVLLVQINYAASPLVAAIAAENHAMFGMLVAIGGLVMAHNLYVGASPTAREVLRWSALGVAILWLYELNLNTVAYLGGSVTQLRALYGLVILASVACLAIAFSPARARSGLKPSRAVAFQGLSLLVIGAYLLVMIGFAQWLDVLGGDFGRLAQVGFVFFGSLAALYWMPSKRLRDWVRVTVLKNMFRHRYDYRAEWLRFNQTVGRGGSIPLTERIVQAMADIADSPSGLLLLPDDNGGWTLAARWKWPDIEVPLQPVSAELATRMARHNYIVELDDVRAGVDRHGETGYVEPWLTGEAKCWALVPLLHFDRMVGIVVLSRPQDSRRMDWEDLDLLKVAGQQLASYLAEQQVQQAMMDAARFDEFNRRMAFVLHDIKNLASQLSLLARNAEKHADNPAFRADMLVTLRNSSDKLTALLARLGRYGHAGNDQRGAISLGPLAEKLAARHSAGHPVCAMVHGDCIVRAAAEPLEQALSHLVQNAIEASSPDSPVMIEVSQDGDCATIQVVDSGTGMSREFIRNGLFKPFVSSKTGGFGIGAFEARELIRAMGGSLDVDSREGLGTRFVISLELAEAEMPGVMTREAR